MVAEAALADNAIDEAPSFLSRVAAVASAIEAERAALDETRRLPDALGAAMADHGLLGAFAPREHGGLALDPVSGLRTFAALAEMDAAVAWVAMVCGAHSFLAGRLPRASAEHVFGPRGAAVAGQMQPAGTATTIDGGYRVQGRWPFGSGSSLATWFAAQCIVLDDGSPRPPTHGRPGLDGIPDLRLVLLPADRVTVHDTWRVSGLKGTASHDFSIEDADVAADYTVDLLRDEPTRPEALYRMPVVTMLMASVASVPVGIARGAVEAFKAFARTKVTAPNPQPASESPLVQVELARAEIAARSAELLLFSAVEEMWHTVQAGRPVTLAQRGHVRLGCVNAGAAAAQAVDIVYNLAGSAAIFERNPFERRFRDVHAATAHAAVQQRVLEPCGRVLFGLEPRGVF